MLTQTKIDFIEVLQKRKYDPDIIPPPENTVFKIQNEVIGNLQSFIVFSGLPKSGKSRYFMAAIASHIKKQPVFSMEIETPIERPKIALFDTESSQYDFYKNIEQLKKFSGVSRLPPTIDAFCTRQDGPKMQKKLISEYLNLNPETSVLIIDGLLDVVMNYNDEKECRELIIWLKKLTTERNILLMAVLHTGKDGTQRLGHLGANTDRWAQSTLTIEKEIDENDNLQSKYVLKSKFLRSSAGITPIEIQYNKFSDNWEMINEHVLIEKNHWKFYNKFKHNEKIDLLFKIESRLNYESAIKQLQVIEKRGQNYCKEYFKYLKENELIKQDVNGFWYDNRLLF